MPEPSARRPRVDPARSAAYDVLRAVRVDGAFTNLVLPQVLREHGLTGRDAAFVTELVAGTIRRKGTYDPIIDACLTRPRLEAKVRDVLRLGVHQLLAMRVPVHAAISTSVDLARARVGRGPTGLVNAVLRQVSAHDLDEWVARLAPAADVDPVGHAALAHSHPRWVVEELERALSRSEEGGTRGVDGLDALLAADNASPRVVLVARPGRAERQELPGEPTAWSPYGVVLEGGDPSGIPAVVEGRAGVQDEGSQLVAIALAEAPLEGRDERWLDLCAGPGGKAGLLAAIAAGRGARLLSAELQPHRARLVQRTLGGRRGTPGSLGVVAADGTRPAWREGAFDRVLVDAPCSGLGALRRRPESRWRRRPEDLADLEPLQARLLGAALDSVRPGGLVLYATCSPVLGETDGVVEAVLAARDDVELVDLTLPGVPDAVGPLAGTVQLWPHRHGTDAMFMALLSRTPPAHRQK